MLSELFHDARHALRVLLASDRAFSLTTLATLALGIGATTAVASVVHAVLLKPLPFPEQDRLVRLYQASRSAPAARGYVAGPDFQAYRASDIFESLAAAYTYRETGFDLTGGGSPERVASLSVSAGYFRVLGTPLTLGREIDRSDENGARIAVVSHALWMRWFEGARDVVGRSLALDGRAYTVIGVAPAGFRDPIGPAVDVWTPLDLMDPARNRSGNQYLAVVGRLRPEATRERAQAALDALCAGLAAQGAGLDPERIGRLVPLLEDRVGDARALLAVLLGAVGLLLMIACVNVATLLLARGAARRKELAIRAALGSGRWRMVRQLLTESLLLAAAGGMAGLVLAYGGIHVLVALGPQALPRADEIGVDSSVLLASAALVLLTPLLFGVMPALHATNRDLERSLRDGGRTGSGSARTQRARRALVIVQIGLAFVLVVAAGLLTRSFIGLLGRDAGFQSAGIVTFRIDLPDSRYGEPAERTAFYRLFSERLESSPGVESVGAVSRLPATGAYHSWSYEVEGWDRPGRDDDAPVANVRCVDGHYFEALGIGLERGRLFDRRDVVGAPPVALINRTLARTVFAGEEPIGRRVRVGEASHTIVGVVGDASHNLLDAPLPKIYLPHDQFGGNRNWSMVHVVRAGGGARALVVGVARRELARIDPDLVLHDVQPLDAVVAANIAGPRFAMTLMGAFAGLALALAAVGLYGVVAFTVASRTREIGIRMAIGASGTDVLRLVLRQAVVLIGSGIALGLAAAAVGARVMTSLLWHVAPTDTTTFVLALLVLAAVGLAATLAPACRAVAVKPSSALRLE